MSAMKLTAIAVLYLFLPFATFTYYFSRRRRRMIEIDRVLTLLRAEQSYRDVHAAETFSYYFWAFAYVSVVALAGLAVLLFARQFGLPDGEFPSVPLGSARFPQPGSRLVFAMAFLGGYVWGMQDIFRRYSQNDLTPGVFYGFGMRMILASTFAVVIYNGASALTGGSDGGASGITANIWPAVAFLMGIFPQRGIRWLSSHVPLLSSPGDPSVDPAPLEMIEGIETYDVLRLEELGIDSCYDLAAADFVPLLLKTAYSARQLIDWILQAKLCVYFGDSVKDLRRIGIRTVLDLEALSAQAIESLPAETTVTKAVLERAREATMKSAEMKRLRQVGTLLGMFSELEALDMLAQTP